MRTRRLGAIGEIIVRKLAGLNPSQALSYDLRGRRRKRVEVKFAIVRKKWNARITEENMLEILHRAYKPEIGVVSFADRTRRQWDCNIQQIKKAEFDVLYYGLYFANRVVIFRITPRRICWKIGYSDFQHRGNKGEGQFHINASNVHRHLDNFLFASLTYSQVEKLLS